MAVIGGCLLGIPMVLFHAPPELKLPLFRKAEAQTEPKDETTVTVATAPTSPQGSIRTAV